MKQGSYRKSGFANRPFALRRRVLEVLGTGHRFSADEIAMFAFRSRRPIVAGVRPSCSISELVSTRRALRRLVAKGRVAQDGRRRRRKVYRLAWEASQ
jgi:hypothetical protein